MFSTTCSQSFYLIRTYAIVSPRSQILRRTCTSCLCSIGTCSKPRDISWLFWAHLYQTIHYKVFQELKIHLSTDSYLWLLYLVVNIVKTMCKWIFLSLMIPPCCKYTYSKSNNVKFLQLTSSELLQELLKLNRTVCCFKSLFYFRIIFVVWVELEVAADSTTIFDNFSCKILHTSAIHSSLNLSL